MDLPPPSYEDAIRQRPGNTPGHNHNHNHNHGDSQGRLPLELQGTSIRDLSTGQVLYKLSRSVTSLPKPGPNSSSSVTFERVEYNNTPPEAKSTGIHKEDSKSDPEPEPESQPQPQNKHLFYLVHPRDAQYRRDTPAYYITCLSADPDKMQGNLQFETRGTVLHGTEFQALLSRGRTWEHKPLFAMGGKVPLFSARREGLVGGQYTWREDSGKEVGHEGARNGESRGLVITSPMEQERRDALVALWVLRIWYEVAESPKAKREELERMTPASAFSNQSGFPRKAGALGALGALGAAGGGGGC